MVLEMDRNVTAHSEAVHPSSRASRRYAVRSFGFDVTNDGAVLEAVKSATPSRRKERGEDHDRPDVDLARRSSMPGRPRSVPSEVPHDRQRVFPADAAVHRVKGLRQAQRRISLHLLILSVERLSGAKRFVPDGFELGARHT
jgi:hypothetical protein